MSLSIEPLEVVQSIDPILDISSRRIYAVYNGGKENSYTPFYSQNGTNNSIQQVTMNPPDENTVTDPRILQSLTYECTFSGLAPAGQPLLRLGEFDCIRQFPNENVISTVDLKDNGQSVNTNLLQYFNSAIRYNNFVEDQDRELSLEPSQLDQYQEGDDWLLYGSSRNPAALYGENSAQASRGGFVYNSVVNPLSVDPLIPITAVVNFTATSPVMLAPYYFSRCGISGVKTRTVTLTFGDLNRVWWRSNQSGWTINTFNTSIKSLAFFCRFITPKLLQNIPKQLNYPYHEILISTQDSSSALAPQALQTLSLNAINLEAVPKRIIVAVREQDSKINYTTSDTFAQIVNISVNYGNSQGKLSSATPFDLYQIAKRNGFNGSWEQAAKYTGFPLALQMGKDIGLSELSAPGLLSNPLLSMQVQFKNPRNLGQRSVFYSLQVYIIYEGVYSITNGLVTKSIAVLTSNDVLHSEEKPILVAKDSVNYLGGSILSTLGDIGKAALPCIIPAISKTLMGKFRGKGQGGELVQYANNYLLEEDDHNVDMGGKKKKKKKGGRMMSRSELNSNMM